MGSGYEDWKVVAFVLADTGTGLRVASCDSQGRLRVIRVLQTAVVADTTEATTWDATISSLLNNLNRIRNQIVTITGETWGTVSHSIADIYATFATKAYVDSQFGAWTAWTPTITWAGGDPVSPTVIARYAVIGKVVHITLDLSAAEGGGASAAQISLPFSLGSSAARVPVAGYEEVYYNDALYKIRYSGYITGGVLTVEWFGASSQTDRSILVLLEGFYEKD